MSKPMFRSLKWLTTLNLVLAASQRAKRNSSDPASTEAGLSLLECVMAIAVIALTAAMITPPLFIAAATRVQNRRAEQAMQIAQGEVDRIQVLVSRGQHNNGNLPVLANATSPRNVPVPTGVAAGGSGQPLMRSVNPNCNTYNDQQVATGRVVLIDLDGVATPAGSSNCQAEFMMQTFRINDRYNVSQNAALSSAPTTAKPTSFTLGVRVYSVLANGNWANLQPDQASLQLTSGTGGQRVRPMSVLYTEVKWSDRPFTLCDYQIRGGGSTAPSWCVN